MLSSTALTRTTGSLDIQIENLSYLFGQRFRREGLGQEVDIGIEPAVMDDGIAGIAGGEQHLEVRASAPRFIGELPSVHAAGENHVREQELHLRICIEQPQPARAFMGRDDVIAFVAQHFAREAVDLLVVLDEQNLFRALLGHLGIARGLVRRPRLDAGSRPSGAADRS